MIAEPPLFTGGVNDTIACVLPRMAVAPVGASDTVIGVLLTIFIVLCIVGVILWGIQQIPGIPPIVKTVVIVIVAVILLVWALSLVQGGGVHWGNGPYIR